MLTLKGTKFELPGNTKKKNMTYKQTKKKVVCLQIMINLAFSKYLLEKARLKYFRKAMCQKRSQT